MELLSFLRADCSREHRREKAETRLHMGRRTPSGAVNGKGLSQRDFVIQ
jgi:hypothetical protein